MKKDIYYEDSKANKKQIISYDDLYELRRKYCGMYNTLRQHYPNTASGIFTGSYEYMRLIKQIEGKLLILDEVIKDIDELL